MVYVEVRHLNAAASLRVGQGFGVGVQGLNITVQGLVFRV